MTNSIPSQFMAWAVRKPAHPAYAVKESGAWKTVSWSEYVKEVRLAARGLMALGLDRGDAVGIMGFNRPEWTMSDLAAMSAGGVPVGVYSSCSSDQVAYILGHAQVRFAVAEFGTAFDRIMAVRDRLEDLECVILMNPPADYLAPDGVHTWQGLLQMGSGLEDHALEERIRGIGPSDIGTLIYTSGTTGPPKGSMLSHENLAEATRMGRELLPTVLRPEARLLSYLPLAHAAERALTLLGPAAFGYTVYYAESIEQMPRNLVEVQPDVFLGVPRVWEKIHTGLTEKLASATGTRARIAAWARGVGRAYHARQARGLHVPAALRVQYKVASALLFSRIRAALGLSNATVLLTGAAPIAEDVLEDLASLDLPIREVYGQTEASGPTSHNKPGLTKWGSVGKPFDGVDVRIADDGEILVRSKAVFLGYYRDPDATSEVLDAGWLNSGDLGHLDEEGFLYVTGRKKEILITAGGKNVSPRNIEEAIKAHRLVNEVVVIGDRRRFLSALVVLEPDADVPPDRAKAQIWEHVEIVNRGLSNVEQIKKIALLPRPLSVEGGELTPTLKLRRSNIARIYEDEIEALYV